MSKTFLDADMDAEIEEMEKENEGKQNYTCTWELNCNQYQLT